MGLLDQAIGSILKTLSSPTLFGMADCKLVQGNASYSPTQGVEVIRAANSWPVSPFPPEEYGAKEITGTNILAGDQRFFLANTATPVEPLAGMLLVIKGTPLRIITVERTYSGDGVAGYTLQCRR